MLNNQVVVVTGGAGLLGRQFVRSIVECGGRAVIADLATAASEQFAKELSAEFGEGRVFAESMDITARESVRGVIERVVARCGNIDALVNCAYPRHANYGRKFEDVEYQDFCASVNLHLGGYFLVSQQFALYFRKQGTGNIITVASIYGVVAPRFEIYAGTPMTMPVEYAVIKSALIHLNLYMMRYFKGSSIRFNCISPGGILDRQPRTFIESYNAHAQSKGMLSPSDVTGAVIFLLSDASKFVNGQNLVVDDGWTA